jgi:hypothetical protein
VHVVEPRGGNAEVMDVTRLDFVQKSFTNQMPMLNFFDHQMDSFIRP